jgi:hypothetical protein
MTQPVEAPGIEAVPVLDERRFVLLYDLYVAGKWIGSARTANRAEEDLTNYIGVEIVAYQALAW